MSIRNSMISCLFAASLAAGCGAGPVADGAQPSGERERQYLDPVRCPDPEIECELSNGKGIYTDEGGKAYVDNTYRIMFTHFNNVSAGTMSVAGRYYNPAQMTWNDLAFGAAQVVSATYATLPAPIGTPPWAVKQMREHQNGLLVQIYHPNYGYISVYGADLLNLVIKISVKTFTTNYLLSFHGSATEAGVVKYAMRWKKDGTADAPISYCWDSGGASDLTVFQERIEVNARTGLVTDRSLTANALTVSCRKGALATCKVWGYDETSSTTQWHFDSCIHMKRASYCGDKKAWTVSGTPIDIRDSANVNNYNIATLEARWSPTGATCLETLRVPNLVPAFDGTCNGAPVPACSMFFVAPYLISGLP